jgi:hypothetical protein
LKYIFSAILTLVGALLLAYLWAGQPLMIRSAKQKFTRDLPGSRVNLAGAYLKLPDTLVFQGVSIEFAGLASYIRAMEFRLDWKLRARLMAVRGVSLIAKPETSNPTLPAGDQLASKDTFPPKIAASGLKFIESSTFVSWVALLQQLGPFLTKPLVFDGIEVEARPGLVARCKSLEVSKASSGILQGICTPPNGVLPIIRFVFLKQDNESGGAVLALGSTEKLERQKIADLLQKGKSLAKASTLIHLSAAALAASIGKQNTSQGADRETTILAFATTKKRGASNKLAIHSVMIEGEGPLCAASLQAIAETFQVKGNCR